MNSSKILQKLTAEAGELDLVFSRLPLDQVKLPDFLFDSKIPVPDQYCDMLPPIFVCKMESGYTVIDGCKRLICLHRKKIKESIFAIINTGGDSFKSSLLRICLNRGRILHLREKILFISWMKNNLDSDEYRIAVSELGFSDRERFELEKLSECPDFIVDAVVNGVADQSIVSDLKSLNENDCQACLLLFSKISFSRQQQRELIEWLPEIAFPAAVSIEQFLSDKQISAIVSNESYNLPQKAQKIRDLIFAKRFPHLDELKKRWTDLVNKTNPDSARVHFKVSENFEKNRMEVRVILTEAGKAEEIFKKLGSISTETWDKLIYPGDCTVL